MSIFILKIGYLSTQPSLSICGKLVPEASPILKPTDAQDPYIKWQTTYTHPPV